MSFALNRFTKQYLAGIDPQDYDPPDWIIDPDVAALLAARVPAEYWDITGDVVTEMSPAQKLAVDNAKLVAASQFERAQDKSQINMRALRAFAEILVDEFTIHAEKYNALLAGINAASNLAELKAATVGRQMPIRDFANLKAAIDARIDQL